jgi:hypothetical protein
VAAPGSAAPAVQNPAGTQSKNQKVGRGMSSQMQPNREVRAGTSDRSRVPGAAPGSAASAAQNPARTQFRNQSIGRGLSGNATPWAQALSDKRAHSSFKHKTSVKADEISDEMDRFGRGLTYDSHLTAGSASGMSFASASASKNKVCRCVGPSWVPPVAQGMQIWIPYAHKVCRSGCRSQMRIRYADV